jgi:hypothetical protein
MSMPHERPDRPVEDPIAQLERAFIEEYLARRGYHLNALHDLPRDQANALLKEATAYASGRLTEVETRAHLVDDLHGATPPIAGIIPKRQD